eukprot:CAMPEP_0198688424 /NCGR_PEP_ID=MMETSP1468-20131203/103993_1 /TAXON_ID=1461545 /ORGANISM="Mantoniella sp, Strain CCMP1436" /LENGTH=64 /DNA_ID=CAMNT_0044438009 /DNA_START=21 /DNA_END=212 /DNA_ORIENTATION=+
MSACPASDASYSGVDPASGVETFAPCASRFSTTSACPSCEAICSAVAPSSVVDWFTSAPLPSSI